MMPNSNPHLVPLTDEERRAQIVAAHSLTTLDQLRDDHLQPEQAQRLARLKARVREWRPTSHSLVLISPTRGIGKTHIARALFDSFGAVVTSDWADVEGSQIYERHGAFFDASELMTKLGEAPAREVAPRTNAVVVVDDLGREGYIKYVAAADQAAEIQARYFRFIDWCYRAEIRLVVTSNLSLDQLASGLGPLNAATWSRLLQMASRRYILQVTDLPDYRPNLGGF